MRRSNNALAQFALHGGRQPRQVSLEHVILRAGAHRLDGVVLSDGAGDDDEGQVRLRGLDDGQGIAPTEARHGPIADHQIPGAPPQRGDESASFFHALELDLAAAPRMAERVQDQLCVRLGVLDEQHSQGTLHAPLPPRGGGSSLGKLK